MISEAEHEMRYCDPFILVILAHFKCEEVLFPFLDLTSLHSSPASASSAPVVPLTSNPYRKACLYQPRISYICHCPLDEKLLV
jgi:hypothetical protein